MRQKSSALNAHSVQLLVSVRNRKEIQPALAGGCDILDFKEPLNGALGMIDAATLRSISESFQSAPVEIPISLALGELTEWSDNRTPPVIASIITYLKMGLAHTAEMPHWYSAWRAVRTQIEEASETPFQWIAVAYADWQEAEAISPQEVLSAAIDSECAGLLIDTYCKQGQSLLDHLSLDELNALIEQAQSHQLKIALAGSVQQKDLAALSGISPDIIGIRGAACRGNLRTDCVQEQAVRDFRRQLERQSTTEHSIQSNSG